MRLSRPATIAASRRDGLDELHIVALRCVFTLSHPRMSGVMELGPPRR
jgi:hypothetical protein